MLGPDVAAEWMRIHVSTRPPPAKFEPKCPAAQPKHEGRSMTGLCMSNAAFGFSKEMSAQERPVPPDQWSIGP